MQALASFDPDDIFYSKASTVWTKDRAHTVLDSIGQHVFPLSQPTAAPAAPAPVGQDGAFSRPVPERSVASSSKRDGKRRTLDAGDGAEQWKRPKRKASRSRLPGKQPQSVVTSVTPSRLNALRTRSESRSSSVTVTADDQRSPLITVGDNKSRHLHRIGESKYPDMSYDEAVSTGEELLDSLGR